MKYIVEFFGWKFIIIYTILINVIGFWAMWSDKKKSQKGKWRISESSLMTICLLGGGIGTITGMYKFRHKTKKLKFSVGMPTILITQIALIIYLTIKGGI